VDFQVKIALLYFQVLTSIIWLNPDQKQHYECWILLKNLQIIKL